MDDDIRDRFRGARQQRPVPTGYGRPTGRPRPLATIQSPAPQLLQPAPVQTSRPAPLPQPSPQQKPEPSPFIQPLLSKKSKKRRIGKKKPLIMLMLLVFLLLSVAGLVFYRKQTKKTTNAGNNIRLTDGQVKTAEIKPTGTIRFIATGDNLAFESINNAAKKPDGSYDYLPLMTNLKPFFDKSDIRLCNESTPGGGEPLGVSAFPNFNAPKAWNTGFAALGCNLLNLGTDHTNDKGQPAIDAMLATWDSQKNILATAGANRSAEEQNKIRYFNLKGIKFAFLSYTTRSNNTQLSSFGVNLYTDALAKSQVAEARKVASLVIVSMNWGNENSSDISSDQDHIAQNLADQNVDVIVGVGPHTLQPAKVLSGSNDHQTLAWFSLGNFLNSQVPVENLIGGMAIMDFDVATQQLRNPSLLPFYMHYEWTAAQRKSQSQADLLARRNFMLYPLDQAADALAKSQNGTTVEAQTERVKAIITKFKPIKVIKSTEF